MVYNKIINPEGVAMPKVQTSQRDTQSLGMNFTEVVASSYPSIIYEVAGQKV